MSTEGMKAHALVRVLEALEGLDEDDCAKVLAAATVVSGVKLPEWRGWSSIVSEEKPKPCPQEQVNDTPQGRFTGPLTECMNLPKPENMNGYGDQFPGSDY